MKNYVKNILIFVVTFSLVFGLCLIPSYAFDDNGNYDVPYLLSAPSHTVYTSGATYVKIGSQYENVYKSTETSQFYFFLYKSGNDYVPCICYDLSAELTSEDSVRISRWSNGSPIWNTYTYSNFDTNSTYNLRTLSLTSSYYLFDDSYTRYATVFDSADLGFQAIRNYIDNGTPVEGTPYNAYFDIPCGNVAYIKTSSNNTLTLSCTMPEYSKLTGSTGTYWTNTMQIAYGVPTYPPTGTTYPLSSMSGIQWFRSTEGRDLLGRTKKALFLDTTNGNDNFIVIYNPTYRELTTSGQGDINPTIRVQCSELIDYHIYSLTGEYNSNGTISSYSIDGFSDPYIGTPTSDNEEVTATNSSGSTPNVGGTGNEIGGDGGLIQYIQGIQKTLDTFANSFISLMKAPISHIQSLISAGTDYFNMIRGLYGWLPDEVQGTINSAMIVSISVGVIALLL